jgi:hypothetical protein
VIYLLFRGLILICSFHGNFKLFEVIFLKKYFNFLELSKNVFLPGHIFTIKYNYRLKFLKKLDFKVRLTKFNHKIK